MQILGKIFNALLFVSAMGGIFCVLSLLQRCCFAVRIAAVGAPLRHGVVLRSNPFAGSIPTIAGKARLAQRVSHCLLDMGRRVRGVFALRYCARRFGKAGAKGISALQQQTDNGHLRHCAQTIGLKKAPALYYGTLENPVWRHGAIRPALLMDKAIVERLNDTELSAVFFTN